MKLKARLTSLALAAAIICGLIPGPVVAMAAESASGTSAPTAASTSDAPTTKAKSGTYIGQVVKSTNTVDGEGKDIVNYKGIKFATFEMFQAPVVVGESDNVYLAQTAAPHSGQLNGEDYFDCLGLEIYLNPESTNDKKAVFMWNYGSAQQGNTTERADARNFVAENPDVIVVLSTHRGNIMGSIDLSVLEGYDEAAAKKYWGSNNLARLDLLACLKWINANISAFGGDPNNVTIGGQSSGSNNVTCLLLMEEAYPYFQKAIMESSFSVDISLQPKEWATPYSEAFFAALGVKSVAELESKPIEELNAAKGQINAKLKELYPDWKSEYKSFTPVIDGEVIPEDYYEKLLNGALAGKTLVFGSNEGEYDNDGGFSVTDPETKKKSPASDEAALAYAIDQNWGKLDPEIGWNKDNAEAIVEEFLSHNDEYGRSDYDAARDLKNDLFLRLGALTYAEAASLYTDVYFYHNKFDITPPGSDLDDGFRAKHSSEILVLFRDWSSDKTDESKNLAHFIENATKDELWVADTISDIWASFILTGDPNCQNLKDKGVTWKTYDRESHNTMVFGQDNKTFELLPGVRQKDVDLLLPLFREYPALEKAWARLDQIKQETEGTDHADAALWAASNGILQDSDLAFEEGCTRAEVLTLLWRAAGSHKAKTAADPFTDVAAGSASYDAVLWAKENGITSGVSANAFKPDSICTKAEIVTFLWRFAGKHTAAPAGFDDVAPDAYYADAVAWAAENGIAAGTSESIFDPGAKCTLADALVMFFQYFDK